MAIQFSSPEATTVYCSQKEMPLEHAETFKRLEQLSVALRLKEIDRLSASYMTQHSYQLPPSDACLSNDPDPFLRQLGIYRDKAMEILGISGANEKSRHLDESDYLKIVQETLDARWGQSRPLHIHNDDLKVGMTLFTSLAIEAMNKKSSEEKKDSHITKKAKNSPEQIQSKENISKIKKFIKKNAYKFLEICEVGFPFSLLENASAERALKMTLENYGSILSHYMLEGNWLSEKQLDQMFSVPFQRLQLNGIAQACADLKRAYIRERNNKAGYYLLWMIKQATGCIYTIPDKTSFDHETVATVLSQFFTVGSGTLMSVTNFIEILGYRNSRLDEFLYQAFLDQKSCSLFLNFLVDKVIHIPMEKWPKKAQVITDFLETLTCESKLAIAKALASSTDLITAEIGRHLSAALTASSLREAIPHFYALTERLTHCNFSHIESIFGRPFIQFRYDNLVDQNDPECVRRLYFNDMRKVFTQDTLMIGVYDNRTTYGGVKRAPPHLLAYDMHTEKMVWGIPLTPFPPEDLSVNMQSTPMTFGLPRMIASGYSLERVGEYLTLQFRGEKKVHFLNPHTGECNFTLALPETVSDEYDRLHISPQGFAYQMVRKNEERMLIGGKVVDKQWRPSFEGETPRGFFHPLSTHCGFHEDFEKKWVVFSPTGHYVTLHDCFDTLAKGDKLYTIEQDSTPKNTCQLTIRTLKADKEVVSEVEKRIPLNVMKASFGKLCENGQLILFSENKHISSLLFVDLNRQEVIASPHTFSPLDIHVISDSGELWTWDVISKKIWKISPEKITFMGCLESGRGTTLLHADREDHLYFVDIPF